MIKVKIFCAIILYIFAGPYVVDSAEDYEKAITDAVIFVMKELKHENMLKGRRIAIYDFRDAKTGKICPALTISLDEKVTANVHHFKSLLDIHFSIVARTDLLAIENEYVISSGGTIVNYEGVVSILESSDILITGTWQNEKDDFVVTIKVFEIYKSLLSRKKTAKMVTSKQTKIIKKNVSSDILACLNKQESPSIFSGEPLNTDKIFLCPITEMKFVYISPGSFIMGSPVNEPGRAPDETQHQVAISRGFYMGLTEVTQGQWKKIMINNPSYFSSCGDMCPVEQVSWLDAQEFIQKLNRMEGAYKYRLPTEAEWEYACRAQTTFPFYFGACLNSDQANYNGNNPVIGCAKGVFGGKTLPVASYPPNAWGLHDMHGNVWEWCSDWFGSYPINDVKDPIGMPTGSARVIRGGGWYDFAIFCRSAFRYDFIPTNRGAHVGFRLVRNQ